MTEQISLRGADIVSNDFQKNIRPAFKVQMYSWSILSLLEVTCVLAALCVRELLKELIN